MTTNATSLLLRRQAETARIVAGAALLFPLETTELIKDLPDDLISDHRSRAFLKALIDRKTDLENEDDQTRWEIAAVEAKKAGVPATWIPSDVTEKTAMAAIAEIKKVVATREGLESLEADIRMGGVKLGPRNGTGHAAPDPDSGDSEPENVSPATWADIEKMLGPITWAWKYWLPNGMLVIVASEPGIGKSALMLRIAGVFILSWDWPDGTKYNGELGKILWVETEAAQAINIERARLWGIPPEMILTPLENPLDDVKLDRPDHLAAVASTAMRPDVRALIVDSLRGAHRKDENSSESIDLVMWLAALARDTGKPVILTHHLRKRSLFDGGDGISMDRLRGSSAIIQPARVVWGLDVPDPRQNEWVRLAMVKNNLARFSEPVGLRIDEHGVFFGTAPETPKIETVADKAVDLLLSLLQDEPLPATAIQTEFDQAGISIASMKRAKKRLGILSIKDAEGWKWSLPATDYEN